MKRDLKKTNRQSTNKHMGGTTLNLHEKYIMDKDGKPEAVVLDFKEFQEWKEDYEDLLAILEAKNEPPIPFEVAEQMLKRDGLL